MTFASANQCLKSLTPKDYSNVAIQGHNICTQMRFFFRFPIKPDSIVSEISMQFSSMKSAWTSIESSILQSLGGGLNLHAFGPELHFCLPSISDVWCDIL